MKSLDNLALLLQKCLKFKIVRSCKQVHASLLTSGINLNTLSLHSKLVGAYASCGDMKSAKLIFKNIEKPNVFALNWMVLGSAFDGYYEESIGYFSLMRESFDCVNRFSFPVLLKVCVGLMDLNKGKEVHCVARVMGFDTDVSVANSLIDMYSKCGFLCYSRKMFDEMPVRDVASYTSMICGYCNAGKIQEAFVLFKNMKKEGLTWNAFTWNAMIVGFARGGDKSSVFLLFTRMIKEGLIPDLVTWNAMISGFAQSQQGFVALRLFSYMIMSRIMPNEVTMTGVLPACGLAASVESGKEIHGLIYRMGLDVNVFVASALIDMYSKCGSVKYARNVFDTIGTKNIASWNAIIGCYGKQGSIESVIELFEKMKEGGIQPNKVTFVSVLSACSHSGEVQIGLKIFELIKELFPLEIKKEHYACVVDMLCRSGKMPEAYEFVKDMPVQLTDSVVGAFFNGCNIHNRRDLARMMATEILDMDLKKPGGFITLSNIYAADGDWGEVESLRKVMKEKDVQKKPGFSWFDKRNQVYLEQG